MNNGSAPAAVIAGQAIHSANDNENEYANDHANDAKVLIDIQHLSKSYTRGDQSIPVLLDINLAVARGDFVALMGPSGSGKSTLLNLIAGIDKPTSGAIEIDGIDIAHLSEGQLADWRAANVGFIFQFYNLMPVLTAYENIELPLLLTHLSRAERQAHVLAALAMVSLTDRMDHYPNELSGGQQQRVAIARALVTDPTLIVADEPTGDLDRHTAEEVLDLLDQLHRELGKTIVMVTHDPKAAARARRMVHLEKGVLVNEDPNAPVVASVAATTEISTAVSAPVAGLAATVTSPLNQSDQG